MKKLLKYLSPFAPDQSGVVSVLFGMGGMTVICDAGGCTGNICGFDEPRWATQKSAIFSAGLRDMDAILGSDDKLVAKIVKASHQIDADMIGIVGTVVPAVIATDLRALKTMTSKKVDIPVVSIEATGTKYYDDGEEETYMELFRTFLKADGDMESEKTENEIGILGATCLDTSLLDFYTPLKKSLGQEYDKVYCYGLESDDGLSGIDVIKRAKNVSMNLVISPAGLKSAKYLKRKYNIPYKTGYPLLEKGIYDEIDDFLKSYDEGKILIIHQQVLANEIRNYIKNKLLEENKDFLANNIVVGTFFQLHKELKEEGDIFFKGEDEFREYVDKEDISLIIADGLLLRPLRGYKKAFIECTHFAISGKLVNDSNS